MRSYPLLPSQTFPKRSKSRTCLLWNLWSPARSKTPVTSSSQQSRTTNHLLRASMQPNCWTTHAHSEWALTTSLSATANSTCPTPWTSYQIRLDQFSMKLELEETCPWPEESKQALTSIILLRGRAWAPTPCRSTLAKSPSNRVWSNSPLELRLVQPLEMLQMMALQLKQRPWEFKWQPQSPMLRQIASWSYQKRRTKSRWPKSLASNAMGHRSTRKVCHAESAVVLGYFPQKS